MCSNWFARPFVYIGAVAVVACTEPVAVPTQVSTVRLSQSPARAATAYTVTDLGTFGTGPTLSLGIDDRGTTFGRYTRADGTPGSFRRTDKDGYEDLGDFEGRAFQILGNNEHGLLNGFVLTAERVQRAVAWLPKSGFTYLDGTNSGTSLGSNKRGAIAGTRRGAGPSAAFVWTEKSGVELIPVIIPGRVVVYSFGSDLNNHGVFAGTVGSRPAGGGPTTNQAFVWDAVNGTTVIPSLGPADLGVTSISDEGLVTGASQMRAPLPLEPRASPLASTPGDVPVHAWKWSSVLGLVDLETLGGNHSVAWNSDKDGNVYGWASDEAGVQHAVKWLANGTIVDLGSLGGNTVTGGLNKHGVVTGWSVAPDGRVRGVLFTPVK